MRAVRRIEESVFFPVAGARLSRTAAHVILTAEFDPLRDEGEEYARRLLAAGNEVSSTGSKVHCMAFCTWDQVSACTGELDYINSFALNADKHSRLQVLSDCVHEQVAKLDPVSRAAGMDCEYPLDKACHVHEKGDVL